MSKTETRYTVQDSNGTTYYDLNDFDAAERVAKDYSHKFEIPFWIFKHENVSVLDRSYIHSPSRVRVGIVTNY